MPKTLDSYLADRVLTRQLYLMRFFDQLQNVELIASDLSLEEMQAQIGSEGPRMPDMGVE